MTLPNPAYRYLPAEHGAGHHQALELVGALVDLRDLARV
jgi:hypothetical protein